MTQKKYRLGIDLGTASLAVVALELDANGEPVKPIWHAVRIFEEPLEKGQGGLLSKKAGRRKARLPRRQIDRRASRLRGIAYLAVLLGLDHKQINPHPGHNFSALRAKAAREKIELADLLRVFLRLAKKRGYQGTFKNRSAKKTTTAEASKQGTSKRGVVEQGAIDLQAEMDKLASSQGKAFVTLGEYLHDRIDKQKLPGRLKLKDESVTNLYALRQMVIDEFETIWSTQAEHHPILNTDHQGKPVKEHFYQAIFFQRPLKSPAFMVGHCSLVQNLPRAPSAQPAAQNFRIEKTIADLRWRNGKPLYAPQRTALRELLQNPDKLTKEGTITFKKIYQHFEDKGCSGTGTLNLDRTSRAHLTGNKTLACFKHLQLLDNWQQLKPLTQLRVINFLSDLGSPEQLNDKCWHKNIVGAKTLKQRIFSKEPEEFKDPEKSKEVKEFQQFINQLRDHKDFDRLSKMGFDTGRSSYSTQALSKLAAWLKDPSWDTADSDFRVDEEAAIKACYPDAGTPQQKNDRLAPATKTYNDVVDGALRQLRMVINRCIDALGTRPVEIILESTRDMGAGAKRRNEWEETASKNQKNREKARKAITESGATATGTAILRYQLWEEQENRCPYCPKKLSLQDALDGSESHFEHILPRSLSQVKKKRSELVIAHASCNDKKGNRTPWQAFGGDSTRWAHIEGIAKRFDALAKEHKENKPLAYAYARKSTLLLLKDFETEVMTDQSVADFADRQLHQSSWIAKAANLWLGSICGNVFVSKGEMTGGLRTAWKLNTVIPEVRFKEGYRVLDEDKKEISAEDFARFKAYWEGHSVSKDNRTDRRIDKRIDHRHHLIDALVIALTSRSVFIALAKRYRENATAQKAHNWSIAPPINEVRRFAMELAQSPNLTHKTDHHPNGQFFQAYAYSTAEVEPDDYRLVKKVALPDLADKSREKTLKNLNGIVDAAIRKVVIEAFEKAYDENQKNPDQKNPAKAALQNPIIHPQYHTRIRRLRCFTDKKADTAIKIEHKSRRSGTHSKLLLGNTYACLDVTIEDGKWKSSHLISIADFRKQPPQTHCRRFFKGDTVIDDRDKKQYLINHFKSESGGQIFMRPITEARPFDKLYKRDGKKKVSGKNLIHLRHHGRAPHSSD